MTTSTRRPLTTCSAITLFLFALLLCTASVGHCAAESKVPTAPRKLVAAIPDDFPPTYFLDKSGNPAGFAVDVMNELAQRMGLTVEYVKGKAWDDVIQMVLSGKADLIPSLTVDERRKGLLAFTDTVEFLPVNLIVASENHTVQGISPGLTIGVMKGSAPENLLMKNQTIRLTTFSNLQTMLFELLAGHVDGIVPLTPNLMKLAADAGVDDKVKVVGKPIIEAKRGIALRKSDAELLTRLNKAIGELIDTPEYRQIYVKWYGKPKPYWTAGRIGAVGGIFLVLIVSGMAFWRYRSIVRLNNSLTLSIAERKQTEDALRESEKRFATIFSTQMNGIIIVDPEIKTIVDANTAALRMIGATREDVIGRECHEFICPAERGMCPITDLGIAVDNSERVLIRIDHTELSILKSVSQLKLGSKNLLIESFIDITDRKKAEEEKRSLEDRLQRSEKMEALGKLAGGVAHDLNNVLGVLTGYSELLLGEIPEGQRTRGYAEKILQSTEKGAAIIQDLLTLARRGVTASDVINLNSVVSDFLKTPVFEKMKDYHPRVTFRTECDKELLNIKGSSVHLEKTLMNMVSNAAESISGIGEVTIRTESRYLDKPLGGYDEVKEGDYAVLTVSDTGMGIPAENREKIFEPFYTKKTMGRSGTGLGLAIVWGTVKDHNGYIDLQTEVGGGTTFTLYFPVTREERIAQQQKVPIDQYMGNGESVLVVDDIAEQRDIAARLLTRLGYQVHVVPGGEAAVEYLSGNRTDILVLDMIMAPGIDGLETYQRVMEINPKQKAIIVSGFSETERVREAQKLGAGAYVKKPYILEKIGVAIRDELGKK